MGARAGQLQRARRLLLLLLVLQRAWQGCAGLAVALLLAPLEEAPEQRTAQAGRSQPSSAQQH